MLKKEREGDGRATKSNNNNTLRARNSSTGRSCGGHRPDAGVVAEFTDTFLGNFHSLQR
jgi:hypothetical protein